MALKAGEKARVEAGRGPVPEAGGSTESSAIDSFLGQHLANRAPRPTTRVGRVHQLEMIMNDASKPADVRKKAKLLRERIAPTAESNYGASEEE
jgi:hypothetical protein